MRAMRRLRWGLALPIGAVLVPLVSGAQAGPEPPPRPAVVVQVAGATIYLDVGSDAGVAAGDTVAVRRAVDQPVVGRLVVVGATARRSVLTFAGPAFPVTRGDTLFVTPRAPAGTVTAPAAATTIAARPRAPPPGATRRRTRVDGALGLEMWGAHSETVGLGADPVRTTRDIGMPAVRFHVITSGDRSRFRVSLRAQQRTGPESVWDRSTRLRIYEARYDLTAGRSQLTLGRFFSDFDHQSAFWDGASLRVEMGRGVSIGAAAGYEPARGNEEVSFTLPKAAAFLGTRHANSRADLSTDLAVTQTFPRDPTLRRTGADLAMRLRVGRFSLTQDLELAQPAPSAPWDVSRFLVRVSVPVGARGSLYGSAVSDRFTPLDTSFFAVFSRRERVTAGYSIMLAGGTYLDLNTSVNNPGAATSGYAAGGSLSVPRVLGASAMSLYASWFDDGLGTGILASPGIEYRLGTARVRGGYQFYRVTQGVQATQTHGADLRLWMPFGERTGGILQVTERVGDNLRSTTIFTSLELRF